MQISKYNSLDIALEKKHEKWKSILENEITFLTIILVYLNILVEVKNLQNQHRKFMQAHFIKILDLYIPTRYLFYSTSLRNKYFIKNFLSSKK